MEVYELVLNGVISLLSVIIGGTVTMKLAKSSMKKEILEYIQSESGAKMIYSMGMMIGAGAKQAIGIGGKGGKFRWQDLIGQVAQGWLSKAFGGQEQIESDTGAINKLP